jgi:hypothetical protein
MPRRHLIGLNGIDAEGPFCRALMSHEATRVHSIAPHRSALQHTKERGQQKRVKQVEGGDI